MKYFLFLCLVLFQTNLHAIQIDQFSTPHCSDQDIRIKVVNLSLCVSPKTTRSIELLGLSNQTAVITEVNRSLNVALSPAYVSISNLHKKLNISIHEFFIGLSDDSLITSNLDLIKQALDINNENKLTVFCKDNLFAFVVTGSNKDYDRIYLNKKDSDVIYQITGEFDQKESISILSSIEY